MKLIHRGLLTEIGTWVNYGIGVKINTIGAGYCELVYGALMVSFLNGR